MTEPAGIDPTTDPTLSAELDAFLDFLLTDAEAEEAWQRQEAMRRHPSSRGHVVTQVGAMTRIEETPVPQRSLIGTGIGTALGVGLMLAGVAVGLVPPHLSGRTIVAGLLIIAGGLVLHRIEQVTR